MGNITIKRDGVYVAPVLISIKKDGVYVPIAASYVKTLDGYVSAGLSQVQAKGFVTDGDSITAGTGENTAPWPMQLAASTGLPLSNVAVSGDTLSARNVQYATIVAPLYNATSKNVVTISAGVNDLRSGVNDLGLRTLIQSYCGKARATGFKVFASTLIPVADGLWTTQMETYRVAYNSWLLANYSSFCDGVIDFASIPQWLPVVNGFYYQDLLHPTNTAAWLMAEKARNKFGLSNLNDTTPDAFSFTAIAGADLSTTYVSNSIKAKGLTAPSSISVTGGMYSINGGAYTAAAATVNPHDTVSLRVTTPAANKTASNIVLTIGGVSATYAIVTGDVTGPGTLFANPSLSGTWAYSNNNRTVVGTSNHGSVRTATAIVGKKVFAATLSPYGKGFYAVIGVNTATPPTTSPGFDTNGIALYDNGGVFYNSASSVSTGLGFQGAASTTIMVVVDEAARLMWFTKNGTQFSGTSPNLTASQVAAGTGGIPIPMSGALYGVVGERDNSGHSWTIETTLPFAPPSGYSQL